MESQWYRMTAIGTLVLAKLFAIAALVGRVLALSAHAFVVWNELLVILFSFATSASWMLAGWKNNKEGE